MTAADAAPAPGLRAATLGPAGSNHEQVTGEYLRAIGIEAHRVVLFERFADAALRLAAGDVDCMVQCAAHPAVARTVGAHLGRLFVIDAFVAASKPLAVLTRRAVARPASIAFHPATRDYVDLGAWREHVEAQSTVRVADGLLAGHYDSGIAAAEVAERHPDVLRVDTFIGSAHDAWLVYAARPVAGGALVAWRDGPGASLLRDVAGARAARATPVTGEDGRR